MHSGLGVSLGTAYCGAVVDHPELISDDPRVDLPHASDFQALRAAVEEHGTLIVSGQAAKILDRSTAQVVSWLQRGKFTRVEAFGGVMLPLAEVMAFKKLRDSGDVSAGGRGRRAPSKRELLKA